MAEPKKNTVKNTLKEKEDVIDEKTPKEPKAKKEKTANDPNKISFSEKISNQFAFAQNERFQKIVGLSLLLISIYTAIAFTSFLFTWQTDQDKVLGNLFAADVVANNWLGKFGALISHVFIHKWFGIASYIFSFLALLTGIRITFNLELLNLKKTYINSFIFLIFVSVALGYVFNDAFFYLGGAFGFTISNQLNSIIGFVGTGVLLCFVLLVYLVAVFNISFDLSKKDPITDEVSDEPIVEEEIVLPINTFKEEVQEDVEEIVVEKPITQELEITNEEKHDIVEEVIKPLEPIEEVKPIIISTDDNGVQFTVEKVEEKEQEYAHNPE